MIATIIMHWLLPGKEEQAQALFAANTEAMLKISGLVERHVLRSRSDPLKWITITIWEDEQAAKAWHDSPDHVWDMFTGYRRIPPGIEYACKYGDATCVDYTPAVGETFDIVTEAPPFAGVH
jgi:quinol monooxygenase YgiN